MEFSLCGQRLHGFQDYEKSSIRKGIIVDLRMEPGAHEPNAKDTSFALTASSSDSGIGMLSNWPLTEQIPSIQTSNTSFIAADTNNIPTISTLQQSSLDNSLRLH